MYEKKEDFDVNGENGTEATIRDISVIKIVYDMCSILKTSMQTINIVNK